MTVARHVYDVDLRPVLGSTFLPTGFPDLGAATFDRFQDGQDVPASLVESVQSMANRLETMAWNEAIQEPVEASPFVREALRDGKKVEAEIGQWLGLAKDTPLDYRRMARALCELDPFCLVHGVFFSQKSWFGQPKFPRAVSAVIEAHDVRRAVSGGRKSDRVRHELDREVAGGGTAEGYGSVPFSRVEWTARRIVASFAVDVELLGSYGLPQPATKLLETVALWEIRSLLSGGLRLRTACDLESVGEAACRRREPLPELEELDARVRDLVGGSAEVLGDGKPISVYWGKG